MTAQYRKVKRYLALLNDRRRGPKQEIDNILYCPCDYKTGNTPPPEAEFMPYIPDSLWGTANDSHAWFRFSLDIPEDLVQTPLALKVRTDHTGWDASNPQFIAYIDGVMRQGLDTNHTEILLCGKKHYDVVLYGYTGPRISSAKFYAGLYTVNDAVEGLYYDLLVPFEMLEYLDVNAVEYQKILYYLDHAVSMLDLFHPDDSAFTESAQKARAYMKTAFYDGYCHPGTTTTVSIGHTHIDCAWKWTLRQTREKVQRSFSTVLELMRRYPEYKFMSSQALLYQNLKEEAPEVYQEVGKMIRQGRWECEGAMWVEADCNLSSGESLVRQILYGKRFFKQEFGVDNHILWLPDVFGYSAALPQILRKSGVDWFVTSKISWNDENKMPYDLFRWQGIDGTAVNTYFMTAQDQTKSEPHNRTTYNGHTHPKMVAGTYRRFQQKQLTDEVLLTFGFGDGGGGPTAEQLELLRRTEKGIPGAPASRIAFAGEFLSGLGQKIEKDPKLPVWNGELYLEFHRGTYTTASRNKRNNRRSEFLYQDTEFVCDMARKLTGYPSPKAELHKGWEMILTNQFHDIIPGSSIKEVYEQCDIDYAVIRRIAETQLTAARQAIADKLDGRDGRYVVFNPHSFAGTGLVKIDGKSVLVENIPAKGYALVGQLVADNHVSIMDHTVETDLYRVEFDENWLLTSLYDKKNKREILKKGQKGNALRLYADFPDAYDAWEWQEYENENFTVISAFTSATVVADGARKGIRILRPLGKSLIDQTVWFYDALPKIDFETHVDWHEKHKMLKTAFPVDIHANWATYEIQFGTIERPTHTNTSWDKAKFEVCAQKYADLSEGGYGVSLINDCKYGHDIHDGVIQLSLLRAPTDPNPEADMGEHTFTYAICPHAGTLAESDTVRLAYDLNYPMTAVKATGTANDLPACYSFLTLDRDNVVCETIKEAEDSDAHIIRLYECKNMRGKVQLTFGFTPRRVCLCDLMENELSELPVNGHVVETDIGGFEILTFKVE